MASRRGSRRLIETPYLCSSLGVLLILFTLLSQSLASYEDDNLSRRRRAVVDRTVTIDPPIPENVANDVTIFDMTASFPDRIYSVTGNSAGVSGMFEVLSGQLRLTRTLSTTDRKKFDREEYPIFQVFATATNRTDSSDIVRLTINIPLSDVNDEAPVFTNQPSEMLATMSSTASPGTVVYVLSVQDMDSNPNLVFSLDTVSPQDSNGRFNLQPLTGTQDQKTANIITVGSTPFPPSVEYEIRVSVEDRNSQSGIQRTFATVKVLVGQRPPQFFSTSYRGAIYETVQPLTSNWVQTESDVTTRLEIKVRQFQGSNTLTAEILEQNRPSQLFELQSSGTTFTIKNKQPLDYEAIKSVTATIRITEAGTTLQSSAQVIISVIDENDNVPRFQSPQYTKNNIPEDLSIGSSVLTVTASDRDSGDNGRIVFSLTSDLFSVETRSSNNLFYGDIKINGSLDFDNEPGPVYNFFVVAKDSGSTQQSSSVQVTVIVINVNDNSPDIDDSSSPLIIAGKELKDYVVTIIQASDTDGDNIRFSFPDNRLEYEIFKINPNTGLLQLTSSVPQSRDSYILNVVAVDDDSCCTVPKGRRTSTATFTANIQDFNSNKPDFRNCNSYDRSHKVREQAPIGTPVIQVSAFDPDRGENGKIEYRISSINPDIEPFQIDKDTGNLTVRREILYPRDGYLQVTVVGKNPIEPPLMEGWCTFRVEIEDINDNAPSFSLSNFEVGVSISETTPTRVTQMVATDADVGVNANITYSLEDNDSPFSIRRLTGEIFLNEQLTGDVTQYVLRVIANDNGIFPGPLNGSTTVTVTVNRENLRKPEFINPPSDLTFQISESAPFAQGQTVITSLSCRSNIADENVEFRVHAKGDTILQDSDTFGVQTASGQRSMNLTLISMLDYLTKKEYQIIVNCLNFASTPQRAEIEITVRVLDANNQVPTFEGLANNGRYAATVAENSPGSTSVIVVTANDRDETPTYNTVTFSLEGKNASLFTIEQGAGNTATIRTASGAQFDRESTAFYNLEIVAKDGAPASPPNPEAPNEPNSVRRVVNVRITDVNDNPPSFLNTTYRHSVSEMANVNDVVFSVTANDLDTVDQGRGLDYAFTGGNVRNAFSILRGTGQIRVARKLDYESSSPNEPRIYRLTLEATDLGRLHTATTSVEITVLDENDNYPVFSENEYVVNNVVVEEDERNTPSNPLLLVQVTATDKDDRPETDIRYSLIGAENVFRINSDTGEVFLEGKLDRDGASPNFTLTVRAQDEDINPLLSYSKIVVMPMDINDNDPEFDSLYLTGRLNEHSNMGTRFMTLVARDPDAGENGTVVYSIATSQPATDYSTYFTVSSSGDVSTARDGSFFDREKIDKMILTVNASDSGIEARYRTADVTVEIIDINDQAPYFQKALYEEEWTESVTTQEIFRITARDEDSAPRNRQFNFKLSGDDNEIKYFRVTTDQDDAVIMVAQPIDYEKDPRFLTFTLTVTDGVFSNSTQVNVRVKDANDNIPQFVEKDIQILMEEGKPAGTYLATFNATDADEGINAEFEFSVVQSSDPRYEFYIHPTSGEVTTRKVLDRETEAVIEVTFMVKDKGEPALNSTTTLTVTLIDINDNAPRFLEDYQPKIPENEANSDTEVVEIFAYDPDTPEFGPPFGFAIPDNCDVPACRHFTLEFFENRAGGNGTAVIKTSSTFDREERKVYYLPIEMWDMRGKGDSRSLRTVNTLPIVIGDKNDNKHKAGHQDILVYNYEGQFGNIDIGRVYAEDPDDWDLPDKTFTFSSPENMKKYFSVDQDTGMITLLPGVPTNGDNPPYEFKVKVYDRVFGNTETCTVAVTVVELTDEAVKKSGAVRISGITAEEFILPTGSGQTATSKYDKFRQEVARLLGYPSQDSVDIVSLNDGPGYLDVRFSAHASPYLNPAQVESAIMLNMKQFEQGVDVKVDQVPINLCMEEIYSDGCYTNLNVTGKPNVINANGTSYTVMETILTAESGCVDGMFPEPVECSGDYCYNGGTCVQDDWGKLSCVCSPVFDGPRCQQRRHHFDGSSAAFYDGLSTCASGRTSIELITTEKNGLIMYSGPVMDIDATTDPQDFLLLELKDGFPHLRINLGMAELSLELTGEDLSDGHWHRIDIDKDDQEVTMTVDHCLAAEANASTGKVSDWSPCRKTGTVPGSEILLNVQSLLQLGGRFPTTPPNFPTGITAPGFNGCLRNLVHNTKLYDLSYKNIPGWNSGENGCPKEETICGENSADPICGKNSVCHSSWNPDEVASCVCHPGFYGTTCETATPILDLEQKAVFKWILSNKLISDAIRKNSFQLMFRTRQLTGTLFYMRNSDAEIIHLQLVKGKLDLSFNMGLGLNSISLDNAPANTGQWHLVRVERYGSEFILKMDGGEGRKMIYRPTVPTAKVLFTALPDINAGAVLQSVNGNNNQLSNDLVSTCVQDIRFNDKFLPLIKGTETDSDVQLEVADNTVEGCVRDDCQQAVCPANTFCFELWEKYECRCNPGSQQNDDGVCVSLCVPNPCFNNAPCTAGENDFTCQCADGWSGKLCNILPRVQDDDDSLGAGVIAGIVIGVLLLIILVILLLLYLFCRRRGEKEKLTLDIDPDDDFIRENVMFYDEEGAGEEDHDAYDLTVLQRQPSAPVKETLMRPSNEPSTAEEMRRRNAPVLDRPDIGSFIDGRINDTDKDDPFADSTHEYDYEGGNSEAGSLSSLATSSSGGSQDYDYLSDWGPKFAKLADMYGAGQNLESS